MLVELKKDLLFYSLRHISVSNDLEKIFFQMSKMGIFWYDFHGIKWDEGEPGLQVWYDVVVIMCSYLTHFFSSRNIDFS